MGAASATRYFDAMSASGPQLCAHRPQQRPRLCRYLCNAIDALPSDRFRVLPSMRFAHFSELMKNASAMIGNSSAGVREAPFIGLPSLDIGSRQTNRAKSASVFFADAHETDKIRDFLSTQWGKPYGRDDGFGGGSAAQRFADVIGQESFWSGSLQKTFHDAI